MLQILFEDDYCIAVNKPPGLLIHRTKISEDKVFLLQLLRDQIRMHLYTVHRLDRGTSGVVLFGKTPEFAAALHHLFMEHKIEKMYVAIARGWLPNSGRIDYPLVDKELNQLQPLEAVTNFKLQATSEIDTAIGLRYPTARFSLLTLQPEHGRRHQIRKHLAHLRHPVIGDRRHGDVKHNNYFRDTAGVNRMLLHASKLTFIHPVTLESICLKATTDDAFQKALHFTGLA